MRCRAREKLDEVAANEHVQGALNTAKEKFGEIADKLGGSSHKQ